MIITIEMKTCDICKTKNLALYIDGKTTTGPWADMCLDCFRAFGVGLGTGRGQQYVYENGEYRKTVF